MCPIFQEAVFWGRRPDHLVCPTSPYIATTAGRPSPATPHTHNRLHVPPQAFGYYDFRQPPGLPYFLHVARSPTPSAAPGATRCAPNRLGASHHSYPLLRCNAPSRSPTCLGYAYGLATFPSREIPKPVRYSTCGSTRPDWPIHWLTTSITTPHSTLKGALLQA